MVLGFAMRFEINAETGDGYLYAADPLYIHTKSLSAMQSSLNDCFAAISELGYDDVFDKNDNYVSLADIDIIIDSDFSSIEVGPPSTGVAVNVILPILIYKKQIIKA